MDKRKETPGCWEKQGQGQGQDGPQCLLMASSCYRGHHAGFLDQHMAHLAPPPHQNHPDAAALSCCPKAFLGGRVSSVTSLSSFWGHCPLPSAQCTRPQAAPPSALPPRERASSVHRAASGEGGHSVPLFRGDAT